MVSSVSSLAVITVCSSLRRVNLFAFSPVLRNSLAQDENVLDFRALMDSGRSVIYNLGGFDEETQA